MPRYPGEAMPRTCHDLLPGESFSRPVAPAPRHAVSVAEIYLRGVANRRDPADPDGTEVDEVGPGEVPKWYALYFAPALGGPMLLCDLLTALGDALPLADARSLAAEMASCLGVPLSDTTTPTEI